MRKGHRVIETNGEKIYIVHKKEPFYSFGRIFGTTGAGDSINEEYLEYAKSIGCEKAGVEYSDGKQYYASLDTWLNSPYKRRQYGGEKTVSLPLSELMRLDK